MRKLKAFAGVLIMSVVALVCPLSALAQCDPSTEGALWCAIVNILSATIELLLGVGGAAAIVFVAIGGYMYIISGGDKQQLETAKSTITLAIVGLTVVILSYLIIDNIICQQILKMPGGCL